MKQFRFGAMAALACALVTAPGATQAQDAPSVSVPTPGYPRLTKLAPNVYGYEEMQSLDRGLFSTGVMFVVTNDGVLLVDGMANPTATKEVVDAIAKVTPKPIKWVVIGSDHSDHTGGNIAFPAGVTYYISPISKTTLDKAGASPRAKPGAWKLPADAVVVDDQKTVDFGGEQAQLMFLGSGHTGGDLEVYLPKEKILEMSEVYLNHVFPAMRSATPTKWLATAKKALAMKDVTTYVPAHGPIVAGPESRANFEAFTKAMDDVIANVTALHAKGLTVDQALAQVQWGPYDSFAMSKEQGQTAVRRIYMELDGQLK
ncbi:MAG TPA: MBL fold metallo-hydrolase [Gemmatimonadaceae bacterium]|jgi:glyoxylase-like metal-dependent hydrolase (beta-lactamase superfamily II)